MSAVRRTVRKAAARARARVEQAPSGFSSWRARFMLMLFAAAFAGLAGRAAYLQVIKRDALQAVGERRQTHEESVQANRGRVFDRNQQLLASSVPTRSIWLLPNAPAERERVRKVGGKQLDSHEKRFAKAAVLLDMPPHVLEKRISELAGRRILLDRYVTLERADELKKLRLNWLEEEFSYTRTYAAGEAAAHVVGFTNSKHNGEEGIERAFQKSLAGETGERVVIQDRFGRAIDQPRMVTPARDGNDVTLSIDSRVQGIAHRALKHAMVEHRALAAAAIVVDARTGEILALANAPTFDPNNRSRLEEKDERLRNRAVSDLFEPGSTIKPLIVAAALERGRLKSNMVLDTHSGRFAVGPKVFSDSVPAPSMTIGQIVQKSSNIGSIRIALEFMERETLSQFLRDVGFGVSPRTGMPGERVGGRLRPVTEWKPVEHATIAFGHGVTVSLTQLARAYTPLARNGDIIPLSIVKLDAPPEGQRVLSQATVNDLRGMLESVVSIDGTAPHAQIRGYRVGGKTGTARKLVDGRYATNKHVASFVGFAPLTDPRLIVVVLIDEPGGKLYYGGQVAAPVFAEIMSSSLHVLGVRFDKTLAPPQLPRAGDEIPEVTGERT